MAWGGCGNNVRQARKGADAVDQLLLSEKKLLVQLGVLRPGDTYAITCGEPMGHPGGTNMLKVCRVA